MPIATKELLEEGTIRCLDPSVSAINQYEDSSELQYDKNVKFELIRCDWIDHQDSVTCFNEEEYEAWWYDNYSIEINLYQSRTRVDYSVIDDYEIIDFLHVSQDFLLFDQDLKKKSTIRIHETVLEDSLINPFNAQTDSIEYLYIDSTETNVNQNAGFTSYKQEFQPDNAK